MDDKVAAILIGGSSHLGKSTVAAALAKRLGAKNVSTDKLARHPGRPWQRRPFVVPPHVADHYLNLTAEQLMASVLEHYRSMAPTIETLVRKHLEGAEPEPLVLEGSAILPETATAPKLRKAGAVWLIGHDMLFAARIRRESHYDDADEPGRYLIEKFLERAQRFNTFIADSVARLKLPHILVDESMSPDDLAERCLLEARPPAKS